MSANIANKKSSSNLAVLHGSPHKDSHTEKLTSDYLSKYGKVDIRHLNLYDANINPCTDCQYCHTHNGCALQDDFQKIAGELDQADIIVLSSPVYYLGFPAPVKAFIDRTQQLFVRRILFKREEIAYNKNGVLICTCGGSDPSAAEALQAPSQLFFSVFGAKLSEMVFLTGTDLPSKQQQYHRKNFLEKEI